VDGFSTVFFGDFSELGVTGAGAGLMTSAGGPSGTLGRFSVAVLSGFARGKTGVGALREA
ncbi:MAG: hypothetical protein QF435_15125, partial [Arenicellales bacterium]|nr:hypothetical protein [Arenicellales bacterium]